MRRLFVILLVSLVAVSALAVSSASARRLRAADTDVELVNGSGLAVVNLRGALIGTLGSGSVRITDLPDNASTDISVQGDELRAVEADAPNTTVYSGTNLRFRVFRGRWKIRISGTGIFASIVGTGKIGLGPTDADGSGGKYAISGGLYQQWPGAWQVTRLEQ